MSAVAATDRRFAARSIAIVHRARRVDPVALAVLDLFVLLALWVLGPDLRP